MNNKYYNKKTRTSDGLLHDSRLEARRWCELNLLQRAGEITDLQRQVSFELVPAQYEEIVTDEVYARGDRKGQLKTKRACVEKSVCYVADFVYTDTKTGETVVEDTKSAVTRKNKEYVIKRKLMRWLNNIAIREVN